MDCRDTQNVKKNFSYEEMDFQWQIYGKVLKVNNFRLANFENIVLILIILL